MNTNILQLIEQLEIELSLIKNDIKANAMSKYMKGKFSYYGISSPERREIQQNWFSKLKQLSNEEKRDLIRELWLKEEREFQYVAIDFLKKWKKSDWKETDLAELEWLITQKSWWDTVDLLASNMLGTYFQCFPNHLEETILDWSNSNNIWLQRSCLLFQLKYKNELDFTLLKKLILLFQPNKEFFIQKAIGWSLRSYSIFEPKHVRDFVEEAKLEGLAKREALRRIIK
jgi:3-methyladenine DNA glycosylase AlkD